MNRVEFEQRCDRALVIIRKRPGTPKASLRSLLGCGCESIDRILASLFTRGEIRLACDRFSSKCAPQIKAWAIEFEPGLKDGKLFQPAKPPQPCKVYIDPSVIGFPEPTRRRIDDLPTSTQWREPAKKLTPTPKPAMTQPDPISEHINKFTSPEPQQASAKRSPAQNRERIERAIAEMIESGIELSRSKICKKAGVSCSYFDTNPSMKLQYDAAIAQIVSSPSEPVADLPKTVREEAENFALQRQIEELEQRNRELREQLQQLQSRNTDELVLEALREDEARLKATIKRIDEEVQELEQERKSAIARLYGIQQAIALRTGEPIQPAFEMVVTTSNGNGKHAVVGGVA